MKLVLVLAAFAAATLAVVTGVEAETTTAILLRPARVWTAGEPVHAGWAVLVQGERIVAVGPAESVSAPADARIIELPGETLIPGLMDLHSHLLLHPYTDTLWDDQVLKEPAPYRTLRAGRQAEATLMAGFTTLRDLGTEGAGYADVSLKRAIEEGLVLGPAALRRHARHRRRRLRLRSRGEELPARRGPASGRAGSQRRGRGGQGGARAGRRGGPTGSSSTLTTGSAPRARPKRLSPSKR